MADRSLETMRSLSPRRNSSTASNLDELVNEQLAHFQIDSNTEFGQAMSGLVKRMYSCREDMDTLWRTTMEGIHQLEPPQRIARFNAKKFLSFQLAKLLDVLQNPFRRTYQSLQFSDPPNWPRDLPPSALPCQVRQYPSRLSVIFETPFSSLKQTSSFRCADSIPVRALNTGLYSRPRGFSTRFLAKREKRTRRCLRHIQAARPGMGPGRELSNNTAAAARRPMPPCTEIVYPVFTRDEDP